METQKQIEVYQLNSDINVFYVTATSFPEGIADAFKKLRELLPSPNGREFFGISCPDQKGVIVYKAAVAELTPGEANAYGCESFTISKGDYLGTLVRHFHRDMSILSKTFETLISHPEIDTHGYCLEVYLSEDDVMCMVKKGSFPVNSGITIKKSNLN